MSAFGQGIGRVLNMVTQIVLARMYGPAQLGFYALGVTTVWLTNVLTQFGMDSGVVRYIAQHKADGDVSRIRGTIFLGLGATFALSSVIAGLIFFGAGFLADEVFGKPFMRSVFRIFAVALPFFTLMNMATYSIGGFQTTRGAHRHGTSVRQVWQPAINLALVVVFYLLGAQVLGAATAYVLSMAAGSLLGLYYLKRVFPSFVGTEVGRKAPAKYEPRALFGASAPMVVANVMPYINTWTAMTVLGVFAMPKEVGIFTAASRMGTLSALVLFAFSGIFTPMVSSLYKKGSLEYLGNLYGDVSRWAFTGSLGVFLLTVLLSKDIMAVFGSKFVAGWPALVLIAGAQLYSSSAGLTDRVLAMTGNQRRVMIATVSSTIGGVAVTFALVPAYGFIGAAAASAAAIVVSNTILLVFVRRILGLWPYDRGYVKPVLAGALTIAGCYLLKSVLPLPTGIVAIAILGPLFMGGFAMFLFALGLSHSDQQLLATLRATVRRKFKPEKTSEDQPDP